MSEKKFLTTAYVGSLFYHILMLAFCVIIALRGDLSFTENGMIFLVVLILFHAIKQQIRNIKPPIRYIALVVMVIARSIEYTIFFREYTVISVIMCLVLLTCFYIVKLYGKESKLTYILITAAVSLSFFIMIGENALIPILFFIMFAIDSKLSYKFLDNEKNRTVQNALSYIAFF